MVVCLILNLKFNKRRAEANMTKFDDALDEAESAVEQICMKYRLSEKDRLDLVRMILEGLNQK